MATYAGDPKARAVLARTPTFRRTDSLGNLIPNAGSTQAEALRVTNLKHRKERGLGATSTTNTLAVGMSLSFRKSDGTTETIHHVIPRVWESGGIDKSEDPKGIKRAQLTDYFQTHGVADVPPGGTLPDKFWSHQSTLYAHSETSAAADPETRGLIKAAVDELHAQLPADSVLVSAALDADSFPNTVCTNACPTALEHLRQHMDDAVAAKFPPGASGAAAPSIRLSKQFMGAARVSSAKEFMKRAKASRFATTVEDPELKDDQTAIEVKPKRSY